MSVIAQGAIKQRLWRGYDDPGLPIGSYIGWLAATGDASGGDVFMQLVFEPEAQNLTGRYFNLEAIEANTSGAAADAELLLLGWSPLVEAAFTNRSWVLKLDFHESGGSALALTDQLKRPIFLGQTTLAASGSSIQIVLDNDNTQTYLLWVEGYIWDARSNQAPGGVRRPTDALYG